MDGREFASTHAQHVAGAVVVAYVPSAQGRAAFEAALSHAAGRGAPLLVVNASSSGATVDARVAPEEELRALEESGKAAGVPVQTHSRPRTQDPVQAVLDVVAESGATLLVIGLRRRSAVGKFLMGSTAQALLMESPVPVLAVKAP